MKALLIALVFITSFTQAQRLYRYECDSITIEIIKDKRNFTVTLISETTQTFEAQKTSRYYLLGNGNTLALYYTHAIVSVNGNITQYKIKRGRNDKL